MHTVKYCVLIALAALNPLNEVRASGRSQSIERAPTARSYMHDEIQDMINTRVETTVSSDQYFNKYGPYWDDRALIDFKFAPDNPKLYAMTSLIGAENTGMLFEVGKNASYFQNAQSYGNRSRINPDQPFCKMVFHPELGLAEGEVFHFPANVALNIDQIQLLSPGSDAGGYAGMVTTELKMCANNTYYCHSTLVYSITCKTKGLLTVGMIKAILGFDTANRTWHSPL